MPNLTKIIADQMQTPKTLSSVYSGLPGVNSDDPTRKRKATDAAPEGAEQKEKKAKLGQFSAGNEPAIVAWVVSDKGKKHYQQDTSTVVMNLLDAYPPLAQVALPNHLSYFAVYDGHGGEFSSQYLATKMHVNFAKSIAGDLIQPATAAAGAASAGSSSNASSASASSSNSAAASPSPGGALGSASSSSSNSNGAANASSAADGKKKEPRDLKDCILETFKETDRRLMKKAVEKKAPEDGACAVVTVITGKTVWIANVGDCKAVLGRINKADNTMKATKLTKDHSPLLIDERKRIEKCGGSISDGRVSGQLGVSRSFNDAKFKRLGVVSQPDITKFTLTPELKFMILACDGLWSVITPEAAVQFVQKQLDAEWQHEIDNPTVETDLVAKQRKESPAQAVCRRVTSKLVTEAVLARGAKDNVTALLLLFDGF